MTEHNVSTGRVWFITGAATGMGRAMTIAGLKNGDRVVATARNVGRLEQLNADFPETLLSVEMDVREEKAAERAVDQAVERFGRIDVVYNNACRPLFGAAETTTDEQIRDLFDTAVFGVWNVMRATLPVLRRQRSGHVLQMSSIFGHMAFPGSGAMAAAKQAVGGFTEAMMAELAPLGIRFTLVETAGLNTGFMPNMVRSALLPDYAATVDPLLDMLAEARPETVSEVDRVAAVLLEVVEAERPPLHLPLSGTASDIIRGALVARLEAIDDWQELTRKVDVPAA